MGFQRLLIETCSICNRECSTCLRQNDPTRSRWIGEERQHEYMPSDLVHKILNEALEFDHKFMIGFVWFNEPLLDERLPEFAQDAKDKGFYVYTTTNGEFLTGGLAKKLDGVLNHIDISIYGVENDFDGVQQLEQYYENLFHETKVQFSWGGMKGHTISHYSPDSGLSEAIKKHSGWACYSPSTRLIITHSGEMAFCCEDIALSWNLGNASDKTLKELWYNPRHQATMKALSTSGTRPLFDLCRSCPRCGSV